MRSFCGIHVGLSQDYRKEDKEQKNPMGPAASRCVQNRSFCCTGPNFQLLLIPLCNGGVGGKKNPSTISSIFPLPPPPSIYLGKCVAAVAKERGGEKSRLWSLSLRNGLVLDVGRGEGITSFPPFTSTHTHTQEEWMATASEGEKEGERTLSGFPSSPFFIPAIQCCHIIPS